MRRLYRRYAKEAVLLDATYKTCKYAVPLYFLVVQTNINFQVVAVIMAQYETKASILEGLNIVKAWNPDIIPKNAMVDFAVEEIAALETAFPKIQVFICSFHREQAWNRWLSKGANSIIPKDEALSLLWNVANATGEEELEQALKELKAWEHYEPLQKYFENTWEPEISRWSLAKKPDNMILNTNNGVERLNEELKYRFLQEYKNCMLSEIISVIVNKFLPQRYDTYVKGNLRMSKKFRKYNDNIPSYLHQHPTSLMKHILERLQNEDFQSIEDGLFKVISKNKSYVVKLKKEEAICSCTCTDYRRKRLPCKHILIVGTKFENYHINQIDQWILSSPVFYLDEELINMCSIEAEQEEILSEENPIPVISGEEGLAQEDTLSKENPVPIISREKGLDQDDTVSEDMAAPVMYGELTKRGSKRRKLINECNADMRSLSSVLYMLPESELIELKNDLQGLKEKMHKRVKQDGSTGLPMEVEGNKNKSNNTNAAKSQKQYGKLKTCAKKGLSGRVGMKAHAMKKARKKINIS